VKKLLVIGFTLALAACAAQQSAQRAPAAQQPETTPAATEAAAAAREDQRKSGWGYVSTLERRDVTGSRINRVRRRGEQAKNTTAGKRVETISREQIEELQDRGFDGLSGVLPAAD